MPGVRARLTLTLVALVALTAIMLGVGSYLFVEASLRQALIDEAAAQARFDLAETIPLSVGTAPGRDDILERRLLETLRRRGFDTIVDLGGGQVLQSDAALAGALDRLSGGLRSSVARGELGYEWTHVDGRSSLVVGGRLGSSGPAFYFVRDGSTIERALEQLRTALAGGGVVLALLALVAARTVARGVLAPVDAAARAAERIEAGDLSARVPVTSHDEFGAWAERFNRMAAALEETIERLRQAEARNRRFVADVSHELRTPLAALVAEASVLREQLPGLPDGARRPAELLVDDVGRLRALVEELMELSRFDAAAERVAAAPVDLARLVRAVTDERLPRARLEVPDGPLVVATDRRRIERILGNLLDNAREHASGSAVEVTLATSDGDVVLAVADRGPGVADEQLPRIFDRFTKADPSRRGGGSSGLGLAIAAEHAALLGGSLSAANRVRGGLRVELRLPVTRSLPGGDAADADATEARRRSSPAAEIPR